jgi:hypothetical protein
VPGFLDLHRGKVPTHTGLAREAAATERRHGPSVGLSSDARAQKKSPRMQTFASWGLRSCPEQARRERIQEKSRLCRFGPIGDDESKVSHGSWPSLCGVGRHTFPRIGAKITRHLCREAQRRHSNEKQINMTPPKKSTKKFAIHSRGDLARGALGGPCQEDSWRALRPHPSVDHARAQSGLGRDGGSSLDERFVSFA